MTRPSAKEDELRHVRAAIELLRIPVAEPPVSTERPDFSLVLTDGRRIGLEHVRAMDESIAGGRGARTRLKDQVHRHLNAAGIKALVNVSLHENLNAYLNTNRDTFEATVADIVAVVRETVAAPRDNDWIWWEHFDEDVDYGGGNVERDERREDSSRRDLAGRAQYVNTVGVHPSDELLVTWTAQGTGQPSSIIQDAITDKAELIDEYRKSEHDEQWLLVVGSAGTGGALDIHDAEGEFVSPFDRTLFLELFGRECVELRTRRT